MRRIFWLYVFVVFSCSNHFQDEDPASLPVSTFDEFWKGVDTTWPAFQTKKVNWDSMYSAYRPQVNSATTNPDLINVLTKMILVLKDAHTNVYPTNGPGFPAYPKYPSYFYGIEWIKSHYLQNVKGNRAIGYGLINPSIGYIYIATFGNSSDQYAIIDTILKEFGNVKGIIIDVRSNGGGNSRNSELISSRFTDQKRLYSYVRYRVDKKSKNLGDYLPAEISPSQNVSKNRVAVLTNRYSYSATEDFLLMMKSFPNVILLGDNTGGGSETAPILKELPNGWTYRVGSRLSYDANKKLINQGIEPNIYVQTSKADSLAGKDTIIERAIFELLK